MTGAFPPPPPPGTKLRIGPLRRTVRLRLTLLYVGLFLASGACLLVITYVLVAQQLRQHASVVVASGGSGASRGTVAVGGAAGFATACQPPGPAATLPPSEQLTACQVLIDRAVAGVTSDALNQLLVESGVALGIMAVGSVGLGWLMAGRVLSPLRTITAAARRVSARSLHQRIGMTGPDDELKELGDTFDELLGRLEASFRAQRQFVANASHELRTPLARQRTLLEVALRDRQATTESLRTACERALAAGEQQERLIAALLTLARGERGLDAIEPFDMGAVAADVVAARRGEAAACGLDVSAEFGAAPTAGDPRLAERLVANLVDNAIRYNVAGGRVEITTGTRNGRAFLAARNTGPVVPPDQLGRLFQPFQRMDRPRTGGTGRGSAGGTGRGSAAGLGLGLAIVGAIAAAHGAELRAASQAAGGLAIEITFAAPPPGLPGTRPADRHARLVPSAEAG